MANDTLAGLRAAILVAERDRMEALDVAMLEAEEERIARECAALWTFRDAELELERNRFDRFYAMAEYRYYHPQR